MSFSPLRPSTISSFHQMYIQYLLFFYPLLLLGLKSLRTCRFGCGTPNWTNTTTKTRAEITSITRFFFSLVNLLAMLDILIHFMKGPLTMYSFFKLWHGSSPPEIGKKLLLLCERVVLHVLISWLDWIG